MIDKKAQTTIFVIVAVLLVVSIILFFTLFDGNIQNIIKSQQLSTTQTINQCINTHVEQAVENVFNNIGFSGKAGLTFNYREEEIPYLCYTALPYARCIPQTPVTISFIEEEILRHVSPKISDCFTNLKAGLESQNYEIILGENQEINLELLPNVVRTTVERDFSQKKADDSRTFNKFEANFQTPLYAMSQATQEIVYQESIYCNSDYVEIMRANTNIEITKFQTGDDNKVYTIEDRETNKGWTFAIRNCVQATPG